MVRLISQHRYLPQPAHWRHCFCIGPAHRPGICRISGRLRRQSRCDSRIMIAKRRRGPFSLLPLPSQCRPQATLGPKFGRIRAPAASPTRTRRARAERDSPPPTTRTAPAATVTTMMQRPARVRPCLSGKLSHDNSEDVHRGLSRLCSFPLWKGRMVTTTRIRPHAALRSLPDSDRSRTVSLLPMGSSGGSVTAGVIMMLLSDCWCSKPEVLLNDCWCNHDESSGLSCTLKQTCLGRQVFIHYILATFTEEMRDDRLIGQVLGRPAAGGQVPPVEVHLEGFHCSEILQNNGL
jgi:hypothetical protein